MYRLAYVACLAILTTSCSEPSHTPSNEDARKALTTTLDAWKSGKKVGTVANADPKVQVSDFQWAAGELLDSYEISGEESSPSSKVFTVKLNVGKSPKPVEAKYHVLGRAEIMIYRDEDFARAMNMDNNPKAKPGGRSR